MSALSLQSHQTPCCYWLQLHNVVTNCKEPSTYQALPICTRVLQLTDITERRAAIRPISTSSVPRCAGTKRHWPLGDGARHRK